MLGELSRNLLHNAIRHTPPGDSLEVRLSCTPAEAMLVFSDSGPGVSDELAARLYQPFSAGDARTGSGLGLAICRQITQTLDGSITLQNRTNHGAVMGLDAIVRLPLGQNGMDG